MGAPTATQVSRLRSRVRRLTSERNAARGDARSVEAELLRLREVERHWLDVGDALGPALRPDETCTEKARRLRAELRRVGDETVAVIRRAQRAEDDARQLREEIRSAIPPTFYAGTDPAFRIVQLVRIWRGAAEANAKLEAEVEQARAEVRDHDESRQLAVEGRLEAIREVGEMRSALTEAARRLATNDREGLSPDQLAVVGFLHQSGRDDMAAMVEGAFRAEAEASELTRRAVVAEAKLVNARREREEGRWK